MPLVIPFKTWPLVAALALSGCATMEPNQKIELDATETAAFASGKALLEARMGRVSVLSVAQCFTCGDSVYLGDAATVQGRVFKDYPVEVQRQLAASGWLDPQHSTPLDVQLTLKKVSHDHTKGAAEQERNPMTNGGELVTSIEIEYRVLRGGQEIFSVPVHSQGATNATGIMAPPEALNIALNKNLRLFLVALRAGLDADYAATQAPAVVKGIVEEKKVSRGVIGDLFVGLAHVGSGAVELLGDTVDVLGSDAFAKGVATAGREVRRSSAEMNRRQANMQYQLAGSPSVSRKTAPSTSSGAGSRTSAGTAGDAGGSGGSVGKTAVLMLPGAVAVQPVRKPRQLSQAGPGVPSAPHFEQLRSEVVEKTADFTLYRTVLDIWPTRGRPVRVPVTYAVRNCMGEPTLDVSVHASEAQWHEYYVRDGRAYPLKPLHHEASRLGDPPPSAWSTLDLKAQIQHHAWWNSAREADARNVIEWRSLGKGLVGCVASQTYRFGGDKLKRGEWAEIKGAAVNFQLQKFEPRDSRIEAMMARIERGDPVPATWND
jgi:hypothetical protein